MIGLFKLSLLYILYNTYTVLTILNIKKIIFFFIIYILAGDVYVWHTSLGSSPLCHCRCEGSIKSVSLATSGPPTFAAMSDHDLQVQLSDSNGQWTCLESRNFEDKVGK